MNGEESKSPDPKDARVATPRRRNNPSLPFFDSKISVQFQRNKNRPMIRGTAEAFDSNWSGIASYLSNDEIENDDVNSEGVARKSSARLAGKSKMPDTRRD